jgi:nitrite reductase/ring-hydroxylating ferredoxin subunit
MRWPWGMLRSMSWHAVLRVGELAAGDVRAVEVAGKSLVIGRDGDRYFACQRQCVHRGADLADGIVSRGHLICPQHGWRFSTATGNNPDASDEHPARIAIYKVRVTGDQIEIAEPEEPPNRMTRDD